MKIKTTGSIVITGLIKVKDPFPPATVTQSTLTGINSNLGVGIQGDSFYLDAAEDDDILWGVEQTTPSQTWKLHPITFNSTTKQFTTLASISTLPVSGVTGGARSASFIHKNKFFWAGFNQNDPSGFSFHADLNIFDNLTVSAIGNDSGSLLGGNTAAREFYIGAYRLGKEYCVTHASSNYAAGIMYFSAGGTVAFTRSAKYGGTAGGPSGGGSPVNSFDNHRLGSQITRIGYGSGTNKERGPDPKIYGWLNSGTDGGAPDGAIFLDTTNQIDLITEQWNGVSNSTPTETEYADIITLPTHTGSTAFPKLLCTSWGNLVIHTDTVTPANSKLFAFTWSASPGTPTVSASQVWSGSVPATEILWTSIDGYGFRANTLWAGERTGENDVWNTIRVYDNGVDTFIDTIKVSVDVNCNHTVTVLQSKVITISSIIQGPGSYHVFHVRNGTDAIIMGSSASPTIYYVENAFF